ncbi:MAG: hypothetical protein JNL47_09545 [Bacteroidia bacterium]|nr:hypothetical protein [Bacteroidia bacterium]
MKRKITLMAVLLMAALYTNGQAVELGTNVLSAGIGLGGRFGGFTYGSQTPGISLHFERMMWEAGDVGFISLGGYAGVKSYKYTAAYYSSYSYSQKWSYTILGVRSAFHYTGLESDNFDLYGGLMLSYNILNYKYEDNDPYPDSYVTASYGSAVGITAYAGGRYFFNQKIGALAEVGYGVSYLTIGLAYKF